MFSLILSAAVTAMPSQVLGREGDVCGKGTGGAGLPIDCIAGLKCEIVYPADNIGFCRKETPRPASFAATASGVLTAKEGDVCGEGVGLSLPVTCASGLMCDLVYPQDKLGFCTKAKPIADDFFAKAGTVTGKKGDVCGAFAGAGFPEIKCAEGLTCNIKYPADKLGFCE